MKQRVVSGRKQAPAVSATAETDRHRRRLWQLLGALAVVGVLFLLTQGWRARLLQESARYRAVIARTEATQQAAQADALAVSSLEAQLANQPGNAEIRLELAQRRWRQEGPSAAAEILRAAPRPFSDPRVPQMLGRCYRLARREDQALQTLDEALKLFPDDATLHSDRAFLYVLLAWHAEAEQEIGTAERFAPGSALLARAALARAKGDASAARQLLQVGLAENPDAGEVKRQLAALAQNAGETDEATRLLRSLKPQELTAEDQVTLAVLALAAKDPSQALERLDQVLATRPGYPRVRFLRARCLRQLGRQAEAKEALEALCREFPRMFGPAFELGEIYQKEGRAAEAGKLFRQHASAQKQRSELRRVANELMRQPQNPKTHEMAGTLFLQRGMYGRAVVELERALQLQPDATATRALLNQARNQIGKSAEIDE